MATHEIRGFICGKEQDDVRIHFGRNFDRDCRLREYSFLREASHRVVQLIDEEQLLSDEEKQERYRRQASEWHRESETRAARDQKLYPPAYKMPRVAGVNKHGVVTFGTHTAHTVDPYYVARGEAQPDEVRVHRERTRGTRLPVLSNNVVV